MSDTTAQALKSAVGAIELAVKWIRSGDKAAIADGLRLLTHTAEIMLETAKKLEEIETRKEINAERNGE